MDTRPSCLDYLEQFHGFLIWVGLISFASEGFILDISRRRRYVGGVSIVAIMQLPRMQSQVTNVSSISSL